MPALEDLKRSSAKGKLAGSNVREIKIFKKYHRFLSFYFTLRVSLSGT